MTIQGRKYLCAYCNGHVRTGDEGVTIDAAGCHCHAACFAKTGVIVLRMRQFARPRIWLMKLRGTWPAVSR